MNSARSENGSQAAATSRERVQSHDTAQRQGSKSTHATPQPTSDTCALAFSSQRPNAGPPPCSPSSARCEIHSRFGTPAEICIVHSTRKSKFNLESRPDYRGLFRAFCSACIRNGVSAHTNFLVLFHTTCLQKLKQLQIEDGEGMKEHEPVSDS